MPPEIPRMPQAVFSMGKSWAGLAATYVQTVEKHLDPAQVTTLVRETIGEETSREKVLAKLLAKQQATIRYTDVEFGQSSIVPSRPKQTRKRKYGDCKDQRPARDSVIHRPAPATAPAASCRPRARAYL